MSTGSLRLDGGFFAALLILGNSNALHTGMGFAFNTGIDIAVEVNSSK